MVQPALSRRYWLPSSSPELEFRLESNLLRTDEQRDVLHSLRHANDCAHTAVQRPEMWKWSIIAMHNAVQGAMVCYLSGTQQLGALKADLSILGRQYNQHDRNPNMARPKVELASFHALFQRTTTGDETDRKGKVVEWVNDRHCRPLGASPETGIACKKLATLRNQFVHFSPSGWSIEVSGLSKIYSILAEFIMTMAEDGWAFRHLNPEERNELYRILGQIIN